MAVLTVLPLEEARDLVKRFGLTLTRLEPLEAGSVNSNFFVHCGSQSYFARIYEEQGEEGARFELTLNERLSEEGIPVARPLRRTDGSLLGYYRGKAFAMYELVPGEILCQGLVTSSACRALGATLARVHLAKLEGLVAPEGRFGFPQIRERLDLVQASGRADLQSAVAELRQWAEDLEARRSQDLPRGLVHGDLFRDNVLVQRSQQEVDVQALLDFESACQGPYVYDLMVTLLAWCFDAELRADLAAAMVEGYHRVRPLSGVERQNMVLEGSVACLRFATTRLTDFSLRAVPGEPPKRDFSRFFQRKQALESGALDRAVAHVLES